jgi:hypothetical protein
MALSPSGSLCPLFQLGPTFAPASSFPLRPRFAAAPIVRAHVASIGLRKRFDGRFGGASERPRSRLPKAALVASVTRCEGTASDACSDR